MRIQRAYTLAKKFGDICRLHPNNVGQGHWEALSYCRTIILFKHLTKNESKKETR